MVKVRRANILTNLPTIKKNSLNSKYKDDANEFPMKFLQKTF